MVKQDDFLMSNQEIIGGLKSAIERGENLKDAMMTFYQAGYSKVEIEEAARAYLNQTSQAPAVMTTKRLQGVASNPKKKEPGTPSPGGVPKPGAPVAPGTKSPAAPKPRVSAPVNKKILDKHAPQIVSNYGSPAKKPQASTKTLKITLILILSFLFGALILVFLFNAEFVEFFNRIFG